jgi:signal recognition particle receptor subunit beta
VDYFERAGLPFVVAVNTFNGHTAYDLAEVRWALAVHQRVPVVAFDARRRASVRDALLAVLEQALDRILRPQAS